MVRNGGSTRHRAQDRARARCCLGAGEDFQHAVKFKSRGGGDTGDAGVRVGAAADRHLGGMRRVDVVGELAFSPQQPVVLLPRHRGAEHSDATPGRCQDILERRLIHRPRSSLRHQDGPRQPPR
jgi:hypothetical protein